MGYKIRRVGDNAAADREWSTLSQADRKNLGLKKATFRKEFLKELYGIRRKKYK